MLGLMSNKVDTTTIGKRGSSGELDWCKYFRLNQEGTRRRFGTKDMVAKDLYSSMSPAYSWDPSTSVNHTHHGGVFNLEFSPEGSVLVAACEKKSILIFDPLSGSLVNHVENAHNNCVNCVRFLDSRMFATCSDDNTVSLWDIRFLRNKIRSLKGHVNWVKNIEYAHDAKLLVTSGFDGSIYTWDINRYSEGDVQFKRVFHTNGLMRTKLSPDASKLVLCTTGGYLMVIHDLDLHTLSCDLRAFKPNMYRLMQLSNTPIHLKCSFNHLFSARRNRVELISDFPVGNEAEVISSLQIHPQGWCALSRNTSSDENSEWTCVHDIQDFSDSQLEDASHSYPDPDEAQDLEKPDHALPSESGESSQGESSSEMSVDGSASVFARPVFHIRFNCRQRSPSGGSEPDGGGGGGNSSGSSSNNNSQGTPATNPQSVDVTFRLPVSSLEALEAMAATIASAQRSNTAAQDSASSGNNSEASSARESRGSEESSSVSGAESLLRTLRDRATAVLGVEDQAFEPPSSSSEVDEDEADSVHLDLRDGPTYFIRTGSHLAGGRTLLLLGSSKRNSNSGGGGDGKDSVQKVLRNRPRLSHYAAEPNVGRGYIKELCFSTDGRLICSPFGNGVRFLGFNSRCSELCDCVPDRPTKLYELASNICHPDVVRAMGLDVFAAKALLDAIYVLP